MHRIGSRTQDSPEMNETATPKPTRRWRKVSIDDGDVYLPLNAPIMIPCRNFVFGQPESGEMAIAPNVEGEKAGDSDGDPNGGDGGDGDADGTTSGSSIDSSQVKTVQLARESQHMRYSRRIQEGNSPVSSRPPIRHPDCLYGDVRRRRRRGRLKIESINVNQTPKGETTHRRCTSFLQGHGKLALTSSSNCHSVFN